MLRPNQVSEKSFNSDENGKYLASEVDAFIAEVSSSYEQVFRENGELIRKISLLANKIEAYRQEEKANNEQSQNSVSEVTEQKVQQAREAAEKMLIEAKQQAQTIVSKANDDAKSILVELTNRVKEQKLVLEMLNKESDDFKNSLIEAYREHLKMVDSLPTVAKQEIEAEPDDEIEDFTVLDVDEPLENEPEITEEAVETEVDALPVEEEIIEEEISDNEIYTDDEPQIELDDEDATASDVPEKEENAADEVEIINSSDDDKADDEADSQSQKGFSLNFSEIDFEDDDDEEPVEEFVSEKGVFNVEIENDEEIPDVEEESNDDGTISFNDFFKKK